MNLSKEIAQFLAPHQHLSGVDFCLPRFEGDQSAPLRLANKVDSKFGYPSMALAERDARSAMHIISLLGCVPEASDTVQFRSPEDFEETDQNDRVRVVFGSRSNRALDRIMKETKLHDLVRFEFTDRWTIVGQDNRHFSIPDPSKMDRKDYTSQTDYGVVARLTDSNGGSVFLIAGLGGRATEGSGLFLRENWQTLQSKFGDSDFAVVLEFLPPVEPKQSKAIAWYTA